MQNFYIDKKGYPRWKDSKTLVHRTVAANKVGGVIFHGYVVHHVDGNKRNFRKNNLWLMTRSAHTRLHALCRGKELIKPF
ncbi:HNH endonuclease [Candidatus Nomurabacteria bacterium]|nr:HNH endonuclease [Candidatus Nomurabacteria bacterium]